MTYSAQTFSVGQVLTAAQMQQIDTNIKDHVHGASGVAYHDLTRYQNALGADVALNNTANFFDGPSVAQGTSGTWFASGHVTIKSTAAGAGFYIKLWDGTTVIAAATYTTPSANHTGVIHLAGYLASPAANIKISVRDLSDTSGSIVYNDSGTGKDSVLTAVRVA
jgi:hypothetical protein